MPNDLLFNARGVRVTHAVARFGSTSYPIANIGSVSTSVGTTPSVTAGLFVVGAILSFFVIGAGGFVLLVGALVLAPFLATKEMTLVLKTSSGDIQALKSQDLRFVASVKKAIEIAFVERG